MAANFGSAGHKFRVEYNCHAEIKSKLPENKNTQTLWLAKLLRIGNSTFKATNTEPKPKLTNIIGKAQHTKVPDEANKANVLKNKEFLGLSTHNMNRV